MLSVSNIRIKGSPAHIDTWVACRKTPILEAAYKKIKVEAARDDPTELCKIAQGVWEVCYGVPRRSADRAARLDRGIKRRRSLMGYNGDEATEAAFLRARRLSCGDTRARQLGDIAADISALEVTCWTDKHEREMRFTENKRLDREAQVADEGALADADSPDLRLRVQERRDTMLVNAQKSDTAKARRLQQLIGGALPTRDELRHCSAHIEDDAWAYMLVSWPMPRTTFPSQASVFIVHDPALATASSAVVWAAILRGAYLMTTSVLQTDNAGNAIVVKYRAALLTRRKIFVSPRSHTRHTRVYDTIAACMQNTQGQKWTEFGDMAAYIADAGRNASVVALVTVADKQQQELERTGTYKTKICRAITNNSETYNKNSSMCKSKTENKITNKHNNKNKGNNNKTKEIVTTTTTNNKNSNNNNHNIRPQHKNHDGSNNTQDTPL